jgi:hypothetical protein
MELHMTYVYQEYPKWVGGRLANNAEEEAALTGAPITVSPSAKEPSGEIDGGAVAETATPPILKGRAKKGK